MVAPFHYTFTPWCVSCLHRSIKIFNLQPHSGCLSAPANLPSKRDGGVLLAATPRPDGTPRIAQVEALAQVLAGQAVPLTLQLAGGAEVSGPLRIAWTVRGPFDAFTEQDVHVAEALQETMEIGLNLPASSESGLYRAVLRPLDEDGRVLDFGARHVQVKGSLERAELHLPEDPILPGQTLPITLLVSRHGDSPQKIRVEVEVYGAYERLLARERFPLELGPGTNEITQPIKLLPDHGIIATVRVRLLNESDEVLDRAEGHVAVRQPVVLDDVRLNSGAHEDREVPDYLVPIYVRLWNQLGVDLLRPTKPWVISGNRFGRREALAYSLTRSGFPAVNDQGVRDPCFHDPAFWEREEEGLRQRAGAMARWSPLALSLGDEMRVGEAEAWFSEYTLAAFRGRLQEVYGDLDRAISVFGDAGRELGVI